MQYPNLLMTDKEQHKVLPELSPQLGKMILTEDNITDPPPIAYVSYKGKRAMISEDANRYEYFRYSDRDQAEREAAEGTLIGTERGADNNNIYGWRLLSPGGVIDKRMTEAMSWGEQFTEPPMPYDAGEFTLWETPMGDYALKRNYSERLTEFSQRLPRAGSKLVNILRSMRDFLKDNDMHGIVWLVDGKPICEVELSGLNSALGVEQ